MIAVAYLKLRGYEISNSSILVAFIVETLALMFLIGGASLIRSML